MEVMLLMSCIQRTIIPQTNNALWGWTLDKTSWLKCIKFNFIQSYKPPRVSLNNQDLKDQMIW